MKLSYLYEQIIRENFKSQKQRFIQQGIEPTIVKSYFEKFKHIKDKKYKELNDEINGVTVPLNRRNDIDAYKDFHELERVVDYVGGQRAVSTAISGDDIEVDGKPVYEDDNFQVFYADSPRACIKYKGKMPYSWCIARSDSSNMFYTYRFKPYEPAFYFVKDKKATEKEFKILNMAKATVSGQFKNKYHFFVIQVPKNIDTESVDQNQYIVTSAQNDGDEQLSWKEILSINPNLSSIREVLEPKPFSDDERKQHKRFKDGIDDIEFKHLSYEEKRNYLDIYPTIGKPISDGQIKYLPSDLLNLYVSFGVGLTEIQDEYVKTIPKVYKRYIQISNRKYDEYMSNDTHQRWQLRLNFSEIRTLSDDKLGIYIESLSKRALNEFLHEGGWSAIEYLKEHISKNLDEDEKSVINLVKDMGNEESLNKLNHILPQGASISLMSGGEDILLDLDGLVTTDFWSEFDVDDDKHGAYEGNAGHTGRYDYSGYFDGWEDGMERELYGYLDGIISDNKELVGDIKGVGIDPTKEGVMGLLNTYDKVDSINNMIDEEFSEAASNAEEISSDKLQAKISKVVSVNPQYSEIEINHKAFYIYLHHYNLFTTDLDDFHSNISTLFEELLDEFGLPSDYYAIDEQIREDEHEYMEVNEAYIIKNVTTEIEKCLELFIDANSDDDNGDYTDGDSKLGRLRYEVIGLLNNTLKGVGQDPDAKHIENDLVEISIDRSKFKLDGSIYIDLYDKQHQKHHEGYVKITDLPTYFQNYKLLETIKRFNKLIK